MGDKLETFSLKYLAELSGAIVYGDPDCKVGSIKTLEMAKDGDISFILEPKYKLYLDRTKASAVILQKKYLDECKTNALVCDEPRLAYAKIANVLYPLYKEKPDNKNPNIHESAVIGKNVEMAFGVTVSSNACIGDNVKIGAYSFIGSNCVIEDNVTIGDMNCILSNVSLCHDITLGDGVIINQGSVIGSDGFGYAIDEGKWLKIPQVGGVVIENDVDIGSNSTIDRGSIENTVIKAGVKIDSQVHVGHNVEIGENTIIAGCTVIAGSTKIGKSCMIAGAVSVTGHIEIADNVVLTGMSAVMNSIKTAGVYSSSLSVMEDREWKKNLARFRKLDKTIRKIVKN